MSRVLRNISYKLQNQIGFISLNNPPNNTLSHDFVTQFQSALQEAESKPPTVLVLYATAKHFCAGADLKERRAMNDLQVKSFVDSLRSITRRIFELPCPTIAAVHGAALGGGLELALACNIRIFHVNAKVGLPETSLAIIPGALGTQMLTRLNPSLANDLILTARLISGKEAYLKGLCQYQSESEEEGVYKDALALAQRMAANGPIALRAAKMAICNGYGQVLDDQVQVEEACYALTIPTKDRLEGLDAFIGKRQPEYKGE